MAHSAYAEVEETLKRIESHESVVGTIVVNEKGILVRTTSDESRTSQYMRLLPSFIAMAMSAVRDLDPQNDLNFVCLRSKKQEIMVGRENGYLLIIIQKRI